MNFKNSFSVHWTNVLDNPTPRSPSTRYVYGERRYMKIQNLGKTLGPARTLVLLELRVEGGEFTYPQKIKQRENIKFPMLEAVSAVSIPAMSASVNVETYIMKSQTYRNMSTDLS